MKTTSTTLFFLCLFITLFAQTNNNYLGKLLSLPQQKVYLSFDKPYYTSGETMYFKAFIADATSHIPDSATTTLYVDIVDVETKRNISQQKIRFNNGQASGSFFTEGVKGTVLFHAYTRWMKNIAADYHFNRSITIFDANDPKLLAKKTDSIDVYHPAMGTTQKTIIRANPEARNVVNLQFFPESGPLLGDFPNRIAFKATDKNGKGVAVNGIIINEKGDTMTKFNDTSLGMGRFNLIAKKGETYTAKILNPDCLTYFIPLPKVQSQTAAIAVDRRNDTADIRLSLLFCYDIMTMPNAFFILAHQRGKVCFNKNIVIKDKKNAHAFQMMIPQTVFTEEGIATITLFDDKGKPLAERLIFIKNEKRELHINITTNKAIFEKRERVTVNIETKTRDGQPVAADLSLAVTNNEKITPSREGGITFPYNENLRAYLLLRSDLQGHIEAPNYYFENNTEQARLALDNLMMTQGWRRFNWKEKADSTVYHTEQDLSVQATVRNGKSPVANASLVLLLTQENEATKTMLAQTDKKGRLTIENLNFTDSARLSVKVANSAKTYTIEQDVPKVPPLVSEHEIFIPETPNDNIGAYLAASKSALLNEKIRTEREITLQEFEVKSRKKDPLAKDPRVTAISADRSYTIDEEQRGPVMAYLQTRFIKLYRETDGTVQFLHGRKSDLNEGKTYNLVIDGITTIDGRIVEMMMLNDVQRIEIIESGNGGYTSYGSTEGVLHILTKTGDRNYWKTHKSDVPSLYLVGYNAPRQFYTPDYSEKKPEHTQPDNRTTVFWSPTVQTDTTGKAKISFYTTDDAHTARILVEGIDGTGKIGVGRGVFKVN